MRRFTVALALIACGKNHGAGDAVTPPVEAPAEAGVDAWAAPPCANPVGGTNVTMRKINSVNLKGILTLVTSPPGDERLFVLELDGRIMIFDHEVLVPTPFMDLTTAPTPVLVTGEMGLLGLAFHPKFATNGEFFVYYSTGVLANKTQRNIVVRCTVSPPTANVADPRSCVELLSNPNPSTNHNGGMIEFGPDGYLYIGTGDAGVNHLVTSQDPTFLSGKILRIDVDQRTGGKEYGIPADNPYASGGGAPEVYILGLRNPWRWSFDRATGDMWIGDVGAATIEELDVLAPAMQRGANLGWSPYEGSNCLNPPCDPTGKVFPLDERNHNTGWVAIVGGQVYRGSCYPDLVGTYFYGSYGLVELSTARLTPSFTLDVHDYPGPYPSPVSLHADSRGELYETDVRGFVWHLEAN